MMNVSLLLTCCVDLKLTHHQTSVVADDYDVSERRKIVHTLYEHRFTVSCIATPLPARGVAMDQWRHRTR